MSIQNQGDYGPFIVGRSSDQPKQIFSETTNLSRKSDGLTLNSYSSKTNERLSDRFIPSRASSNLNCQIFEDDDLKNSNRKTANDRNNSNSKEDNILSSYSHLLHSRILGDENYNCEAWDNTIPNAKNFKGYSSKNILKFKSTTKKKNENDENRMSVFGIDTDPISSLSLKNERRISKVPYKVLDAPQLQDDFYLNLVDWSSQNILVVGLANSVYIWSACTSRVTKLCEIQGNETVSSLGWNQRGTSLAVGVSNGETQIWDIGQLRLQRTLIGHQGRVSAVAWNANILSTGSRDKYILNRDLRSHEDYYLKLTGHKQEVCGLKWSFDSKRLASGGNDNKIMIWDSQYPNPLAKYTDHQAAVKAIAFSPHQHYILASGGGTADRCIKFWNTLTNECISSIDTGSQVCNLMFSKTTDEIVSTHGYSLNQIIIWNYPSMTKVSTLTGHTYRVLYLSMSPDGDNIVTGAGDETLRFWNVFPAMKTKNQNLFGISNLLVPASMDIR